MLESMSAEVRPETATARPAVALRGITKRFPGVVANDRVDFQAAEGEVHALLGENGAGKSTLSNNLTGLYLPDEGEIELYGRRVDFHSPRDALDAGVCMVHQHFRLVAPFTVAEQLALGEQQRVEIVKALYREARILILDEPTAVLTPQEAETLFATLRAMAAERRTVIFISHKLHEVKAVADRVTVLRGGRSIATVPTAGATPRSLAALMVGHEVEVGRRREREGEVGAAALEIEDLWADGDRGQPAVKGISLSVRAGEIVA